MVLSASQATCKECAHNLKNAWFGLAKGTHCRGCHKSWSAGSHCYGCHRHFSSGTGFDLHQRGACDGLEGLRFACGAPKYLLEDDVWTGTLHEKVCKNWTACGFRGTR